MMISSDQIIAKLEQPLCVLKTLDQQIVYKNVAFTKLFGNITKMQFKNLNEALVSSCPAYFFFEGNNL